jgi:hypothetical protein
MDRIPKSQLKRVLSVVREKRDFHGRFLVYTHGSSSNDIGILVCANELVESQELPGGSVWVGSDSYVVAPVNSRYGRIVVPYWE